MMDIVLATRNRNKVEEMRKILTAGEDQFSIYTLDDFPACNDVEEDGETFEENAVKKAVYIFKYTGKTSIADDSGLEVEALNGAPGIFSARYTGEFANDETNTRKLLEEMKSVPYKERRARFVCCIAVASAEGLKTFSGHVNGRIGTEKRGFKGFGYDPIFYPDGYEMTFAEMSDEEKNSISHRAIALGKLQKYLLGNT
jgi:XTP/dITP diphosphohydrolase